MRATGRGGTLTAGGYLAATLGAWCLEVTPTLQAPAFDVEAVMVHYDSYWIGRAPLRLSLAFGRFRWEWDEVRPSIHERAVLVRVWGRPRIVRMAEVSLRCRTG